jgi:hypothetical protein
LALAVHDSGYVDAYYGPDEWKQEALKKKAPLKDLKTDSARLYADLKSLAGKYNAPNPLFLRYNYLLKQVAALDALVDILQGKKLTFDQESQGLYDAVAPQFSDDHFEQIIAALDKKIPGRGTLQERLRAFNKEFAVPKDKLQKIIGLCIAESRRKTARFVELPEGESVELEPVSGKPWPSYNWYKGQFHSLIQFNTDISWSPDDVLDLSSHEGYPGHHVLNSLLEKKLLKEKGWIEYSIYLLYSPESLIAEGTATMALDMVYPDDERLAFLKTVVFPAAGLNPDSAQRYAEITKLLRTRDFAALEARRRFLDGKVNREATIKWLVKYNLQNEEQAESSLKFAEAYRSYVINYSLGRQLIKEYIARKIGRSPSRKQLWEAYVDLLESPRPASALQ